MPAPFHPPSSAVEEGLDLCKKLRLPPGDQTLAQFTTMQGELAAMLKEASPPADK